MNAPVNVRLAKTAFRVLLIVAGIFMGSSVHPVLAQSASVSEISKQSDEILLKELDLERFYLNFWIHGKAEPKWRRLRYFLLQQGTAAGFMTQNIMFGSQCLKHINHPEEISDHVSRSANNVGIVAASLGCGASTFELLSNINTSVRNKITKRDPGTAKQVFRDRLDEIDKLIRLREQAVAGVEPSGLKDIMQEEGLMLRYLRDWCVSDLLDIYADVKSHQSANNVFYSLDATANAMQMISFILGRLSVERDEYEGPGAICAIPGDAIAMISAPFSAMVEGRLYKHYHDKLAKQFGARAEDPTPLAESTLKKLDGILKDPNVQDSYLNGLKIRLKASEQWSNRCVEFVAARDKELRHLNDVAAQQNIIGPLVAGTSMEEDIGDTVAIYKYSKHSPKTANALNLQGNIVAGTGSAFSLASSTWYYLSEARHKKKLKRKHELPDQLLDDRLAALDRLSSEIQRKQ